MATNPQMPTADDLLWHTLKALDNIGGSASVQELLSQMSLDMKLSDDIINKLNPKGSQTTFYTNAALARTSLKRIGAIDNTEKGVWVITNTGRDFQSEDQVRERVREFRATEWEAKKAKGTESLESEPVDVDDDQDWKDALLDILQNMPPTAFERLCQLVLRESGFTRVEGTKQSHDGGIDGAGVLRVNLISFTVRFQCKRYAGSVSASAIRDFRGAMSGLADKGLFITTGVFTREAQREAARDGATAIDLIDGSELCALLKDLSLGVKTETVQKITPEPEFFEKL